MFQIFYNGPRNEEGVLGSLDELLAVMACNRLDARFLEPGELPYEGAARVGVRNPEWQHSESNDVPEWLDGEPIYPESPNAIRFFGNFIDLSHAFTIDTDEPEQIKRLRAAIAANMASGGAAMTAQQQAAPVDALAVLDDACECGPSIHRTNQRAGETHSNELTQVRAAFAELIEADKEYNEARDAHHIARVNTLAIEKRLLRAENRRTAARARLGGAK